MPHIKLGCERKPNEEFTKNIPGAFVDFISIP